LRIITRFVWFSNFATNANLAEAAHDSAGDNDSCFRWGVRGASDRTGGSFV